MRATRALKSLGCQISAGRVGHVEALGILLWSRCVKPDPVQRVSGPHPVQNPPTSRAACAKLDNMSVSQSQTESGGLVGSSSRALLPPPGAGILTPTPRRAICSPKILSGAQGRPQIPSGRGVGVIRGAPRPGRFPGLETCQVDRPGEGWGGGPARAPSAS